MRIYIQWATSEPGDYEPYVLSRVRHARAIPRRSAPLGGETLDTAPGWIADVVVQGVSFAGNDHVAFAFPNSRDLAVITWNDDPEDYPEGPVGQVWTFHDPAPDSRYGGRVNTRQALAVYTDDPALVAFWTGQTTSLGPVVVRTWAEFPTPDAADTLHGIWQTDDLYARHRERRTLHGWQEWVG